MVYLATTFWQKLEQWDQWLFTKINTDWQNIAFDHLMPFLRTSLNWAPLYLFLAVLVLLNFRQKGVWWSLLFLATVAMTDLVGNYVFKHGFERLRPCNDPDFYTQVRLLADHCGAGYSFISNHAANHFGMAAFFLASFRPIIGNWAWAGMAWAVSIAYAQVYVGVHYPLDVAGGALLGLLAGSFTGWVFNKRFPFKSAGTHTLS